MKRVSEASGSPRWNSGVRGGIKFGLLAILALTTLVQANPATRVLQRDQGFYVYIGQEIVHGKLPYADAWESKPPAIFYLNAVGIWLTRGSRWGVWILEAFSLVLALYLSFEFMRRRWGPWPAMLGTALWMYGLDRAFDTGGNYTEEYPLPLHFMAIILMGQLLKARRHRLYCLLLGALFALAFLFRPNNAAPEAAVVLTLLLAWITRKQYRDMVTGLAFMALGTAVCFLIPGLYFWSKGLLQEMIDASILYHMAYAGSSAPSLAPFWNGFQILGIGVAVAALGYGVALYQVTRRSESRFLYVFLLIGWPITILTTDPAGKAYAHYFINWLPFVAVLAGLAVFWLQSHLPGSPFNSVRAEWAALLCGLGLTLAALLLSGRGAEYGQVFERLVARDPRGIESRSPTAIYAENHTKPGDYVLFWSILPGENYMADRPSPTASLYYPGYYKSDISTRLSERFLRELVAHKPVLIIDMGHLRTLSLDPAERQRRIDAGLAAGLPDNIYQVFDYIEHNYHLVAVIKGKSVYRLNGTQ